MSGIRLSATRVLTAADTTKLDAIEAAADVTDTANVEAAGAVMASVMTTIGDVITASAPGVEDRIAAGAAGTVLVGLGAGVKPAFQAVAGLAADVLDAVIVVPNVGAGGTDAAATVDLKDLAGAAATRIGIVKIVASDTLYAGLADPNANVTFAAATKGSILAAPAGQGMAVVKTDANGQFACTIANAVDETVQFSVATVEGGVDVLARGVIVRGCVPDAATWAP